MIKNFSFILLFIIIALPLQAQNLTKEIIWLKNGEVYQGKIVMQNEQILMLQTENGKRYQFLISDVEKIEIQPYKSHTQNVKLKNENSQLGICAEISGGLITKNRTFLPVSPNYGFAIAVGTQKMFGTKAFAGAGVGLDIISLSNKKGSFYTIPFFLQINMPLGSGKVLPAVVGKAGYVISLDDDYKSNLYFNLSGGVNVKIENMYNLFVGLYIRQIGLYGKVTEKNELGTFIKNGNAPLTSTGLQIAFLF